MYVSLQWVVPPNCEISNSFGYLVTAHKNLLLDSPNRNLMFSGRIKKGHKQIRRSSPCSLNADLRYACLKNRGPFYVLSSIVANPTGEMTMSSEQKVYEVVLKQAALVKKQMRSTDDFEAKPDVVLPGNWSLLSEAYDRCREVCAEYAKTFYLG